MVFYFDEKTTLQFSAKLFYGLPVVNKLLIITGFCTWSVYSTIKGLSLPPLVEDLNHTEEKVPQFMLFYSDEKTTLEIYLQTRSSYSLFYI